MSDKLVSVEGVSKKFCRSLKRSLWYGMQDLGREIVGRGRSDNVQLRPDEFWAVKDVDFELKRGECLGLIGPNGAGKTTLLRMLNGLIKPDKGFIRLRGRVGALIALGAGFNPILTGRENIKVNGSVLGLTRHEIDRKTDEIIAFAELEDFIDAPVQNYSSGMAVRLGFAIAATVEPEILLLDEVLAVGDAGFREKCYSKIGQIKRGAATIIVSHHMPHINQICSKVLLLEHGRMKHLGDLDHGVELYQEGCSRSLGEAGGFKNLCQHFSALEVRFNTTEVRYGDPLNITVEIDSRVEISNVLVRIVFVSLDNDLVAEWNSDAFEKKIDIKRGVTCLCVFVDKMLMKSGKYYVNVIVYDDTRLIYLAHINRQYAINVTGIKSIPSRFLVGN